MDTFSKLMLSDEEQQLVNDPGWILTKRRIMDKAGGLLGLVCEDMQAVIAGEKDWLPAAVVHASPKIAKGENYGQLPYLMLDYPRCFDAANIFAIRTMFWWGNYFSITLHISGKYKDLFQQKITANLPLVKQDIFICIHESQWHHHFGPGNYTNTRQLDSSELSNTIDEKNFIKLAVKFPLGQWHDMPSLLGASFKELIELLKG